MAKKKKTFTINGIAYIPIEFDFNTICEFDEMGISISEIAKKPTASARAYLALYHNNDKTWAGNEIQTHIVNGGSLEGILEAFTDSLSNSGFFHKITEQRREKENEQDSAENQEAESE